MRVLTGIQPSGLPHLGNYFGMMRKILKMSQKEDVFLFIADLHALTTVHNKEKLQNGIFSIALDFLSLGLDPEKVTFYRQSQIQGHTELAWILATLTPLGLLKRAHSFKDKISKGIEPSCGLFYYPILMAADILLYDAEIVPVGKDQKQHVEITRDLALKFNDTFGKTFILPKSRIDQNTKTIPGIDGQKMSKSYGNTIDLFADEKILQKKVMSIITDSRGVNEPKDPQSALIGIAKFFLSAEEINAYLQGGIGNRDIKQKLALKINNFFAPFKEKRRKLQKNPKKIEEILQYGQEKAQKIASKKLAEVKNAFM